MRRPMFSPVGGLYLLAAVTFVSHLAFGLYYATTSDHLEANPSLNQRGEAFLAAYRGWNSEKEGDTAAYNRAAVEVLRTGVPRTRTGAVFFHAPLYAYFVAACYGVGGVRLLSVAVPQAVLAGLTCLLIGLAARRLAAQRAGLVGGLAAALVLVNLRLAMYVGFIVPTMLTVCLAALALEAVAPPVTTGRLARFLTAMILCCYAQAVFFVIALGAALWLLWEYGRRRQTVYLVCATLLLAGAMAKPLATILGLGGGKTDPLAKSARSTLWEANNPNYESMTWTSLWERRPGNPWTKWHETADEQRRCAEYLQRADRAGIHPGVLWIRENPGQYAKLCWVRFWAAVGPFTGQMSPRNRAISTVVWLLVYPAGFVGLWRARGASASWFVLLGFAAITAFSTLVIVEWYQRYRLPVDVMLTAFAAIGYGEWRRGGASSLRLHDHLHAPQPSLESGQDPGSLS